LSTDESFEYGKVIMALYLPPHSPDWSSALEAFNPQQAAHTRQIIKMAGNADV